MTVGEKNKIKLDRCKMASGPEANREGEWGRLGRDLGEAHPWGQSASGVALFLGLADRERLSLLGVADRERDLDLERDLETLRARGRDADRDRERERERLALRTGVLDRRTGLLDLRAGEADLLRRLEYEGDRCLRSLLRLRDR